jgi:DNA-binding SARP family transcriptional activator
MGRLDEIACQHSYQEVSEALYKGDLERAAEILGEIEKENLSTDQYPLISVAYQICSACIQTKAEIDWYLRAQHEAGQRIEEYQKQLLLILSLIVNGETSQEIPKSEDFPIPHPIPISMAETKPLEKPKHPGLWQRFRTLIDSLSPPPPYERTSQTTNVIDKHPNEILKTVSPIEEPVGPVSETERKHERIKPQVQEVLSSKTSIEEPIYPSSESEKKSGQGSPSLVIYCLGPFRVFQGDKEITEWRSFKGRDILKYLLMYRDAPVAKDILTDVFWPEVDPKAARRNLHQTIYSLRQTLRGEQPTFHHIWFENECYFLNPQMDIWLDFLEFEKYIQAGKQLDHDESLEDAIKIYETAEQLYQGDFLQEDLYEDWPVVQRQNLFNRYLRLADRLTELYMLKHRYAAVVTICTKVLAKDRTNETAHRQLMQCYLVQGLRHLAVRQFRICDRALREELGILPSEETVDLYHRIVS